MQTSVSGGRSHSSDADSIAQDAHLTAQESGIVQQTSRIPFTKFQRKRSDKDYIGRDLNCKHSLFLPSFLGGIALGVVIGVGGALAAFAYFGQQTFMAHKSTSSLPGEEGQAGSFISTKATPDATTLAKRSHAEACSTTDAAKPDGLDSFGQRCFSLVAMLLVQSVSGIILDEFGQIIERNHIFVMFLTMMIGLGGNVGGQSVCLAVRRLALGEKVSVMEQVSMGVLLSCVIVPVCFLRVYASCSVGREVVALAVSVIPIVLAAAFVGTVLPVGLFHFNLDPAHAIALVQVLMDIVGVSILCVVTTAIL
jgi:cation transporter-like permease